MRGNDSGEKSLVLFNGGFPLSDLEGWWRKGRLGEPLPFMGSCGGDGCRSWAWMLGVGGFDSPRTAVVGRKREAMMTRWLRREFIVADEEEEE